MAIEEGEGIEHFDVLVVGAGISGIGSAHHLATQLPGKSFAVLEAQAEFGGTWHTHRYPGIRSDSDLHTFGYRFKPWTGAPIAAGDRILDYLGEVLAENDLARHVRYGHRLVAADWSSAAGRWTLEVEKTESGERVRFTTGFLWMCQGYYRHEEGYTPDWQDMDRFEGRIVHPQHWPDDLDCSGKRVVVIGSGATAATLVPALAPASAHVTMLQRSPTYFLTGRNVDTLAETLRDLDIDERWIHEIVRRKRLRDGEILTRRSFEAPDQLKADLLANVAAHVGEEITAQHFTPRYRPWQQRIAFLPDGDLFAEIGKGRASVVTAAIERFTETGILLETGEKLEADIIVTATGFSLSVMGGIAFSVDGTAVDWADTVNYRGTLFTGVPNLAWVWGYFRASWTLRVELVADFVCRLLGHMDAIGAEEIQVALRPDEIDMPRLSWMDPADFNPGYMMRDVEKLPRRIDRPEWRLTQDYAFEREALAATDFGGSEFIYRAEGRRADAA